MIDWTDFSIKFEIFVNGMWIREYQTSNWARTQK